MTEPLHNDIRHRRQALDLTQEQLAGRVGITRQGLSAIERGLTSPSTTVALQLARELGCAVEDLFWLDRELPTTLTAHLSSPPEDSSKTSVMVARVGHRWVAHPLSRADQAVSALSPDGQVVGAPGSTGAPKDINVELFHPSGELTANLLIAGCAPALRELEHQTARHDRGRARWLPTPSLRAIELLASGEVHVAGIHVADPDGDDFNRELVRAHLDASRMEMVTLLHWRTGLFLAPGNPHTVGGIEDLARDDLRLVDRPPDSGAHLALRRWLTTAGINTDKIHPVTVARSHHEVALSILYGQTDVGVGPESVARALGLTFLPLDEERFDLVFPRPLREEGALTPILDTLNAGSFRRSVSASSGYDTTHTGTSVAL